VDLTLPMNPDGEFSLDNTNGSVEVTTWEKNEIHIVAEKRMRPDDNGLGWLWRMVGLRSESLKTDEAARELFAELKVEVTGDEARREVNTEFPRASGVSFSVAYTITAPRGMRLRAVTTNGAIRVEEVEGTVDVQSTNGSITMDDVTGDTEARSTNGRILIDDAGKSVVARTTNGSVTVSLDRDLDEVGEIHLRSVNGRLALALPEGVNFDLSARTVHGRVGSEFDIVQDDDESRRKIEGRHGDGGPQVELETVNGSVRLTKLD